MQIHWVITDFVYALFRPHVLESPGKIFLSPGKPWNLVFASPGKSWKQAFWCLYESCTDGVVLSMFVLGVKVGQIRLPRAREGWQTAIWPQGWAVQKRMNRSRCHYWGLTHVGPRHHVLDGGQDRTNPFAAGRGGKSAMQPFIKIPCPHHYCYS